MWKGTSALEARLKAWSRNRSEGILGNMSVVRRAPSAAGESPMRPGIASLWIRHPPDTQSFARHESP